MKSYAEWSARGQQLGWSPDQYSEAAYQGYVNNIRAQEQQAASNPAPRPVAPAPAPQQNTQINEMQQQIKDLTNQLQGQADKAGGIGQEVRNVAQEANKQTLLTAPQGISFDGLDPRKKKSYLNPQMGA